MLEAHARWRIEAFSLGGKIQDADVVQEVWLRALPRLGDIEPRGGRLTPPLLRFLGSTLVRVCFEAARASGREHPAGSGLFDQPPEAANHPVSVLARRAEDESQLLHEIEQLGAADRAILLMRIMEGIPNRVIAQELGITESMASRQYLAAVSLLRARLPASLFDEVDVA